MAGSFEDQLAQLLAETQLPAEGPRKQAELHLLHAQSNPAFPTSLAAIASHGSVAPEIRQSALSVLRRFVEKNWSGQTDDEGPAIPIADATKEQLRVQLLQLATSNDENRRVKSAARYANSFVPYGPWMILLLIINPVMSSAKLRILTSPMTGPHSYLLSCR